MKAMSKKAKAREEKKATTLSDAVPVASEPSQAEVKMKANMAAKALEETYQRPIVEISQIEDLTLRSTYLQAKLLEQQYLTVRADYMALFDRRADVAATLRQIEEANEAFNKALKETHSAHGTSTDLYVYDMDKRALAPRSGVSETPVKWKESQDEESQGDAGTKEEESEKGN